MFWLRVQGIISLLSSHPIKLRVRVEKNKQWFNVWSYKIWQRYVVPYLIVIEIFCKNGDIIAKKCGDRPTSTEVHHCNDKSFIRKLFHWATTRLHRSSGWLFFNGFQDQNNEDNFLSLKDGLTKFMKPNIL